MQRVGAFLSQLANRIFIAEVVKLASYYWSSKVKPTWVERIQAPLHVSEDEQLQDLYVASRVFPRVILAVCFTYVGQSEHAMFMLTSSIAAKFNVSARRVTMFVLANAAGAPVPWPAHTFSPIESTRFKKSLFRVDSSSVKTSGAMRFDGGLRVVSAWKVWGIVSMKKMDEINLLLNEF